MTDAQLVRNMKLDETSLEKIREAVTAAEAHTSGEIAVAVTPESSDYSFFELRAAVMLGALCYAVLLPFYSWIQDILAARFWLLPGWALPAFYAIASFGMIALFFLIANIPAMDRILIPAAVRQKSVYARALRHFVESGVYATRDRTGILIFISWMEHAVYVVADEGIHKKIEADEWNSIADRITEGIRQGDTVDTLCRAISRCGDILATSFPADHTNPDELPNGLVLLEAGS